MNNKIVKFGTWGLVTILVLGFGWYFFMANALVVFELPTKKIITRKCDHEGLRQVEIYRLDGNATTNPSIHVSIHLGCDNYEPNDEKIIFIGDSGSIMDNDLSINLVSFDSLTIEYKRGLRIFTKLDKVVFPDSTLNLIITYKELE